MILLIPNPIKGINEVFEVFPSLCAFLNVSNYNDIFRLGIDDWIWSDK